MKSLYNWILNGNGRGKRYLLAFAMIFASMSSFVVYFSWNNIGKSPAVRAFIAQVPPLTIQNGHLIEPVDAYQDIVWMSENNENDYHLIIDTKSSDIDLANLPKNGVVVGKNDAYISKDGAVTVQSLDSIPDLKITPQDLEEIMKNGSVRFSWILFFSLTFGLFVTFYIWSLLFALLSYILTLFVPSEKYSFPVRRRLSVVCLIVGYIIFIPLTFIGLYASAFAFFFFVLLLMSFILSTLPKSLSFSIDKK